MDQHRLQTCMSCRFYVASLVILLVNLLNLKHVPQLVASIVEVHDGAVLEYLMWRDSQEKL